MERENVSSSNITSIGYDVENEILEVEFKGSIVYQYLDVLGDVYEKLMCAPSIGVYFSENIRKNYDFKKL